MAEKIKQTVFVYFKGAGTDESGFTFNISNVAFQPDTLIVKGIDYQDSASAADNLVLLYSNLVGNRPLVSFVNVSTYGFMQRKDIYFPINIKLQGTFQFKYMTVDNNLVDLDGDICIELEFSKGYY